MIDITYDMPVNNEVYKLTITGHAEAEDPGKFDLVCAAVSTLAFTLAQCLKDADELGWLRMHPTLKMEDGDACIKAKAVKTHEPIIGAMFTTIVRGLEMLAVNYPDNITLTKVLPDYVRGHK